MSLRLAIVGCGRMGRLFAPLAPEYGFDVRAKSTRGNNLHDAAIVREFPQGVDRSLESTAPDSAPDLLTRLASLGRNVGCGKTAAHARERSYAAITD